MSDPDSNRSDRPIPSEQPAPPRSGARHAAPRMSVRDRMQLPVGRMLAMTAVPTALLVGSIAPKLAFAADASKTASTSTAQATPSAGATGAECTQASSAATPSASSSASSAAKSAAKTATASPSAAASSASASVQKRLGAATKSAATTAATAAPSASSPAGAAATPSASATTKAATKSTDPITGLLDGLGGLLSGKSASAATASPSASASPTTAPRAAAVATASTPSAAATSAAASPSASAPAAGSSAGATASPSSSASSSAPASPTASASANPSSSAAAAANKLCDASKLAAPVETLPAGTFPVDPWTLKTSRLELINAQFWGVKTVHTAGGDVRVLKFTAQEVNIDNLDMSAPQDGRKLHVQGGSGTTSTMRGGTVTMYVTSLSGTLSKAEGIPLAWLGVSLTLTPDTLPAWLYDLIGSVPIPLTLELTNATAIQAGQTGGNLTIPGMHLYYTPLS
ncbi:hypothetical protein [Streptacidiphilus carbonis]|uniref:hypothetical protein n=1 Tax=Streptacidiphilus carbonis TaxID=105422 RepID=UPI0005A75A5D|nr:hypothetical protein [Streptacidiphilus carbonis]